MVSRFEDRQQAGRLLAERLGEYSGRDDVIVLGLPRGGIPVAFEVAERLDVPLDVFVVRKLGVPGQEELAMGAIASGNVRVLNEDVIRPLAITPEDVEQVTAEEQQELERRERIYRGQRPRAQLDGRVVILVDDGLATGSTMRAAVAAARQHAPSRVVVAVPTGAPDTFERLAVAADECICLIQPEPFYAVGLWYENFEQTTDQQVRQLLEQAHRHHPVT